MRTGCELAAIVVVAGITGCGTYTTYQTAEPLAPGRWQVSAAATTGGFYDRPSKVPTPALIS